MTLSELLLEQQIENIRRLDRTWVAYQEEARARQSHAGLRHRAASALVRLGTWLDATAGDASTPRERTRTRLA